MSKESEALALRVHKTYEALLNSLSLSDEHAAALNRRGFTPRDISRAGYCSLPASRTGIVERLSRDNDLEGVPGFWRDERGRWQLAGKNGLLIPVRRKDGKIIAIKIRVDKPSSPSAKYLLLSSNPRSDKRTGEVKYPHGTSAPLAVHYPRSLPKQISSIRITEGELKADLATEMTPHYTVSIPGITSWRLALDAIRELKPKEVRLAFDSDKIKSVNSEGSSDTSYNSKSEAGGAPSLEDFAVGRTLASLYLAAKEIEGMKVIIEDWPAKAGKGIDDVLMNGATDLIREMTGEEADEFADEMLRAELPDGWIYVVKTKQFINTRTNLELDKEAFADRFAHETKGNAATKALANPAFPKCDLPIYTPSREMIYKDEEGVKYYNRWRANSLQPKEGSAKTFLAHAEYVFPDKLEREIVLDYLAWNVQRPGEKIHWALLIQGVQGTGKSYFGLIMRKLLGENNVSLPTNENLHEVYTEWQRSCQLIIIEELMARGRMELMNKFKPMITQDVTVVREMRTPSYRQPNVFNFLLFTNHEDAIIIDSTDRRYCVIFSPAVPRDPKYYEELFAWTDRSAGLILNYLLKRDLSAFKPKAHAPMTAGKAMVIKLSENPLLAYLREAIEEEKWPFLGDIIAVSHLLDVLPPSIARLASNQSVGKALRDLGCRQLKQFKLKNGSRVRGWSVRRHDTWAGVSEETLSAEYEKWLSGSQPGGSPDAINPLRDSKPL